MFKIAIQKYLRMTTVALLVCALALGASGVQVAHAASFTVTNTDDSGAGSLRQAIADTLPGDTITFDPSLAGGFITLTSGQLVIDKDLTISGPGSDQLVISGNNASRVMEVTVGVTATIQGLTITNGQCATCDGGGIKNSGTLTVTNSVFSGNTAQLSGGAIENNSTLTVSNSTFSGNRAEIRDGGAIHNTGSTAVVSISNTAFIGNSALRNGGGAIRNDEGTLTVSNSTFSSNTAITDGGAIQDLGRHALIVTNSTFYNNSATFTGGAIRTFGLSGSTLSIQNSTFVGNNAPRGGGIYHLSVAATLTNSTFTSNSASNEGGGIYISSSTLTLTNTIIANSPSGGNCSGSGAITDGGGNLSYPDTTCPGINADPKLLSLADNGGPTQTIALDTGSAAIDAAVLANCSATDQRGVSRPQGEGCDIGAYELEPQPLFNFSGFFQPVDNLPTLNTVKAGQGVPVKFSLDGDQGLAIFAANYPVSQQVACEGGAPVDAIEQTIAAGGSSLSYDPATDTYTYVWKTESSWKNTCRQLIVKLSDGTEHMANFKFK